MEVPCNPVLGSLLLQAPLEDVANGWFPIAGLPQIPLGMPLSYEAPTDSLRTSFPSSSIGGEFKYGYNNVI